MSEATNGRWHHSIDEVAFENGALKVGGWIHQEGRPDAITEGWLVFGDGCSESIAVPVGRPSPDVAPLFGGQAAHARFEVITPVPQDLSRDTLAYGALVFRTADGTDVELPLTTVPARASPLGTVPLRDLRIGLGITTYNRCDHLRDLLDAVRRTTSLDLEIVVADDGSSDDTRAYLANEAPDVDAICADNRGIAWNKNRALFHLWLTRRCDVVLLIEDDVRPARQGWDIEWALATLAYGHVNYAPPWFFREPMEGAGRWYKPFDAHIVSGQFCGFSAEALSYVGFLDTRFGRYGHEHVEHTLRMIRAGFGGTNLVPGARDSRFLLMNGGLDVVDSTSSHSAEAVERNATVFDAIWNESVHRWAWRTDEEMLAFKAEMEGCRLRETR